jgi:ferredoxin-NADP reductase
MAPPRHRDTQVGGVDLPAGSRLLIVTSSANHDDGHFEDADLFDIRRDNASDHLTFGYGSHQCMGKNLARMEMQIFLEEFTRRLPHMRCRSSASPTCPTPRSAGRSTCWSNGTRRRTPSARTKACATCRCPCASASRRRHAIARPVVVERVTPVAEGIVRLRLVSPDGKPLPRWTPGAHIDVECGTSELSRQYSLCGDPDEAGVFEIAVLHEPEGRGGSAWVHANVKAGDRLRIRGPRNHFRLDESLKKAIFIAGGIGITPVSAMARRAKALGMDYELHYSGRSRASMAFVDELAALHGERLHVHAATKAGATTCGRCSRSPCPARRCTPAARCACSRRSKAAAPRGPRARCAWSISNRRWPRSTRRRNRPSRSS